MSIQDILLNSQPIVQPSSSKISELVINSYFEDVDDGKQMLLNSLIICEEKINNNNKTIIDLKNKILFLENENLSLEDSINRVFNIIGDNKTKI
jgi:hypothetical protein